MAIVNKIVGYNGQAAKSSDGKLMKYTYDNGTTPTPLQYFTYTVGETVTINAYDVAGGLDVVIPTMIESKPVAALGFQSFVNRNLTSIVLPSTLTTLGQQCLAGNKLSSISLPSSLTTIQQDALADLGSVTSLSIPISVTSLAYGACSYNLQLVTFSAPGVTFYDASVCQYNPITTLTVAANATIGTASSVGIHGFEFNQVYTANGKLGGTYTWNGTTWTGPA